MGSSAGKSFSETVGVRQLLFNDPRKQSVRNATRFPHGRTLTALLVLLQLSQIPCFRDDSDFPRINLRGPSIAFS
jgi:hypothetical protein